jgi:catechol 2,3-dioxygenase-like lactoylglutathione lyase family enzyme
MGNRPRGESGSKKAVRYNGVNHLAMATGDMDRAIRFWRDLLGMRLVAGLGDPGCRHYFFELSDRDLVAFFGWLGGKPVPEKEHGRPVRGPFIFDHVSFGVDSEEDLWILKSRLESAGFYASDVIDHGFIHSIYSYDPNGIPIGFSANLPGRDVRKTPRIVEAAPSQVSLEGPEPRLDKWPVVERLPSESERAVYPGAGGELFHGKKGGE